MQKKVILVWFRNDLRTNDNEVLLTAVQKSDFVIPVYIFDPRYYQQNKFGFQNTGDLRHEYIVNTVYSLKQKLQDLGGDLLTYQGYPEEIIPHLVQKYDIDEVYHHREVAQRETKISELVEENLWSVKRNLKHYIGHTLFHKEDLPFPIRDIPNDFNTFKKKVNKESFVRPSLTDIESIVMPPHLEKTEFPFPIDQDENSYGENAALHILNTIPTEAEKNMEAYYLLSPFLATGVISPAFVFHFLNKHINSKNKKGINAVLESLFLRDYFRFMLKKYPSIYFTSDEEIIINDEIIKSWTSGRTESEIINKLIIKLNETGNLNRQERELLELYFIYELRQHWLVGASWFEQQLIDYAPATIYGHWAHAAGKGTSTKNNLSIDSFEKIKESLYQTIS